MSPSNLGPAWSVRTARLHLDRKLGRGRGGWLSSPRGNADPAQPPPRSSLVGCGEPYLAMISSPPHPPRSGRGCRVPAVRPGALRWETHLDPAPVAAGRCDSARQRAGGRRGEVEVAETRLLRGDSRPQGTALPSSIPARTKAKVLGSVATPREDAAVARRDAGAQATQGRGPPFPAPAPPRPACSRRRGVGSAAPA